ncbi:MAG TPA: carboxypeptidase regulatory-like domain-containing protein [Acidobacteriota bacterium]|nr:carboxypeptidase regulatory-like domain-containing protein [Acidobacteriota bacterium]
MRKSLLCFLMCFFLSTLTAWSQTYTATIRGTVTDASKAVLPGATVTATEVGRDVKHTIQTDSTGRYVLAALPPGSYVLTVEAVGFKTFTQPAFTLVVQQQATIDVELSVSGVSTSIEVVGATPLLNTAAPTMGQVIENKFMQTAPLSDRNPLALIMLTPGLVPTEGEASGTAGVNFVANGTRNSTAEVVLDGAAISGIEQNSSITDLKYTPSVDVIEEFKVQTNYFSAEFGNTGGSIVNMVSKSGTNEFHGVGYGFFRNSSFNANDFFSNQQGLSIPETSRKVFGFTMGGPIIKGKTFFFADYEGNRSDSATSTTTTVPTALQLAGDFSQTFRSNGKLYTIYNPYDTYEDADGYVLRHPFAGNKIPDSLKNPISAKFLKYYPAPTSDGNPVTHANNFFAQGTNSNRGDQMDIKIDHHINEKQRLSGRYSSNWTNNNPFNAYGNIARSINPGTEHDTNFVLDYTRMQSPKTIITTRFSVMRVSSIRDPISTGFDSNKEFGLSPLFQYLGVKQMPNITATSYASLGAGGWAIIHRGELVGLLNGSLTKIMGSHTIKTGAEGRKYYENYFQPGYPAGRLSFSRGMTGQDPLTSSSSQGNGIATLLLGWGSGGEMDIDYPTATSSGYLGFYVQDDWRVSSKLTLNLGLRYDFDIPRTERFDRLNWFDYNAPSPIAGKVPEFPNLKGQMVYASGDRRSPYLGDYNNIQPRFGLAYALGKKMSVRAAYGIYYSVSRASIKGEVGSAFRSGSSLEFSRDSNFTQYATLANPFPTGLTLPPGPTKDPASYLGLGFDAYDPHTINPQIQQWNLSIQRELPGNSVLEVSYGGSKGTHLSFGTDDVLGNRNKLDPIYWKLGRDALTEQVPNPFYGVIKDPNSVLSLPTVERQQLLLPYPQYDAYLGGYVAPPYIGNSIYHSAQFKFEKRFTKNLGLLAHYTISKLITDSDSPGTDIDWLGGFTGLQNWKNLHMERSLATFDIPKRFVLAFNYQLPFGRGKALGQNMNKVADAFLGGWEISSILTLSAGYPIVPQLDSPDLLSGDQRPNINGNPCGSGPSNQRINGYFNDAAFSQPDPDVYGNAPRTLPGCRTFGQRNGDVTLMKNFRFTETKYFQFRVEAFNVTNTPIFGRPNEAYGSDTFGQITGVSNSPRQLQLAVKFYY